MDGYTIEKISTYSLKIFFSSAKAYYLDIYYWR